MRFKHIFLLLVALPQMAFASGGALAPPAAASALEAVAPASPEVTVSPAAASALEAVSPASPAVTAPPAAASALEAVAPASPAVTVSPVAAALPSVPSPLGKPAVTVSPVAAALPSVPSPLGKPAVTAALAPPETASAETAAPAPSEPLTLKQCLDYALENNIALQKDRLGLEEAALSKKEVVGSLLPQLNSSGSFTYNIQKTAIAMPNFVNSMMPEAMRDPNADKYMTVTMGMDLSANWGVALTQQLLNFTLFTAVSIADAAADLAEMGTRADTDDVIAQTAALFYNVQVLDYSMELFDESLSLMDRMAGLMETNLENGLVRKVDADRIKVTKMNLETEKLSVNQALEVQKNLLKLQMGFPMTEEISVEEADLDSIETMLFLGTLNSFDVEQQIPFKMLKQQQEMLSLQRKSAISEVLPALTLSANYSQNYMGDHFHGETYHHFPVSMVSLNLRVPLFTGFSKTAKIKKAGIALEKSRKDEQMLVQSLTMGYDNARMQLIQNRNGIDAQRRNKELATDVLRVTESNYNEGIATLSDVLNATSSQIQAQMNYVTALSNCVKAYIDLKKADGTIQEINK